VTKTSAHDVAGDAARPRTLAQKVWDDHVVASGGDTEPDLIYIDLHLVHEVTSPQAFDGLRLAGRPVRRPELTIATEDHNVPTIDIDKPIADPISRNQVETLRRNCAEFGIRLYPMGDIEQGIVHVVGPQLGLTQPGMTIVCGDSHTSTHGAFGALAMGIGTSEVEHVLATQTLPLRPFKTMAVNVDGQLPAGVTAKDIILAVIAKIGTGGGQGHVIEYRGSAIESLPHAEPLDLHFALGNVFEREGNTEDAFAHFLAGNTLKRADIQYDESAALAYVDALEAAFANPLMDELRGCGNDSERPIFIVGMPRSGSTLVEQLLAAHPAVSAAGEVSILGPIVREAWPFTPALPVDELRTRVRLIGDRYLRETERFLQRGTRLTDKTLEHLQLVPLIHVMHCTPFGYVFLRFKIREVWKARTICVQFVLPVR